MLCQLVKKHEAGADRFLCFCVQHMKVGRPCCIRLLKLLVTYCRSVTFPIHVCSIDTSTLNRCHAALLQEHRATAIAGQGRFRYWPEICVAESFTRRHFRCICYVCCPRCPAAVISRSTTHRWCVARPQRSRCRYLF